MKMNFKKNIAYILAGLLVIVVVSYLFINKNGSGGFYACTMDALICPDGSAVGRTGPSCEFSACPNQTEAFIGGLMQQGGEYRLVMIAPDTYHEVTYAMPLKFSRISNVIGTLVGKNVRVIGTFSTGNTLEVESIEEIHPSM